MALCELGAVKTRLGIGDATQDTLLTQMIATVSARFDIETDRKLERVVDHEQVFQADTLQVVAEAAPVESVTSFALRYKESDGWEVQAGVDYLLLGRKRVICFNSLLGHESQAARVIYTGGYVVPPGAPGAGQVALPKELEMACIEQVAAMYQLKSWSGVLRVEASAGTYLELADREWVPWVKRVLRRHRRKVMQ